MEGMEASLLRELLAPLSDPTYADRVAENPLSKLDFYEDGLTGAPDSVRKRNDLAKKLALPDGMSANALLEAVRILVSYEEYLELVGRQV